MDKERREQGAKERMNLTMAPHPLPDMITFKAEKSHNEEN